jgi:hypothetical protein
MNFITREYRRYRVFVRRLILSTALILFSLRAHRRSFRLSFTYDTSFDTDGGGAQLHSRIATWAFAEAVGARFLNTPMRKVDHGSDEHWVPRWNRLIAFRETVKPDLTSTCLSMTVLGVLLTPWPKGKALTINLKNPHFFTDAFPEVVHAIRPQLRDVYQTATTNMDWTCDFGIHLRLYQPKDVEFTSSRLSRLDKVIAKLGLHEKSKSVVLFSSPDAEKNFSDVPEHFSFCSEDALETISKMVLVRNLVIGKSSMSYVAGLISEQTVWYPEFWHPPMPDWKRL